MKGKLLGAVIQLPKIPSKYVPASEEQAGALQISLRTSETRIVAITNICGAMRRFIKAMQRNLEALDAIDGGIVDPENIRHTTRLINSTLLSELARQTSVLYSMQAAVDVMRRIERPRSKAD